MTKRKGNQSSNSNTTQPDGIHPGSLLKYIVKQAGLGGKETRMLEMLNIWTVQDLLEFDMDKLKKLKGCSSAACKRLVKFQEGMRRAQADDTIKRQTRAAGSGRAEEVVDYGRYYAEPATLKRLNLFPFFSEKAQSGIKPEAIHCSYKPDRPLAWLNFQCRAADAFEKYGLHTVGELLLITPKPLLKMKNFAGITYTRARRVLEQYILREKDDFVELDRCASLGEAFLAYLDHLADERDYRALVLRRGLKDGVYRTLENAGREVGVTKERVRQIERDLFIVFKLPQNIRVLQPLREAMRQSLAQAGGRMKLGELAKAVDAKMGFSPSGNLAGLECFAEIFDDELELQRDMVSLI